MAAAYEDCVNFRDGLSKHAVEGCAKASLTAARQV